MKPLRSLLSAEFDPLLFLLQSHTKEFLEQVVLILGALSLPRKSGDFVAQLLPKFFSFFNPRPKSSQSYPVAFSSRNSLTSLCIKSRSVSPLRHAFPVSIRSFGQEQYRAEEKPSCRDLKQGSLYEISQRGSSSCLRLKTFSEAWPWLP